MHVEFVPKWEFGYLEEFARKLNLEIKDDVLYLPSRFGDGFAKRVDIDGDLCIIIHSYTLKEPLTINRVRVTNTNSSLITFRFICYQESDKNCLSKVQVLNDAIDVTDSFLANTPICNVIVKIKLEKLLSIIDIDPMSKEFSAFTNNLDSPFIYQEYTTLEINRVVKELSEHSKIEKLEKLFYKIKVMELIYHFFVRFSRRNTYGFTNVNKNDIEKILSLESLILHDLKTPPKLPELARAIGMCESKMKQLFKRIYGDSIYNYYLSARLNEAAALLKKDKSLTISEVGYSLGFSNLSHFAQLFNRYIGMNPKEYAMKK